MDAGDPRLEEAWEAFDGGEAERALELARGAPAKLGERCLLECLALGQLGEPKEARAALERALAAGISPREPDLVWARGALHLLEWKIAEARRDYESLARGDRSPEVLERLSFCAELEGKFVQADALYREARQADPEAFPRIARLTETEFEAVVREAIEELPEEFQAVLEDSEVVVAPVPTPELAAGSPDETPPDLLGLFVGPSLLERAEGAAEATPIVYLFQRNLERSALDREELRDEIVVTLYHELGHLLGFDEEGVDELGLG